MDSFIEYMIQQKKTAKDIIKQVLVYTIAVFISLILMVAAFIFIPQFISFAPMVIALVFFGAYKITSAYNVEYEYILTNGELDIDKITNRKKRKRLLTVHCKTFTCFSKVGNPEYKNEENAQFSKVIDARAHSKTYDDYYAVFFINGQKTKLLFNPTQKMIDIFKIFAPRVVK